MPKAQAKSLAIISWQTVIDSDAHREGSVTSTARPHQSVHTLLSKNSTITVHTFKLSRHQMPVKNSIV
jgi:hypothetical protein